MPKNAVRLRSGRAFTEREFERFASAKSHSLRDAARAHPDYLEHLKVFDVLADE